MITANIRQVFEENGFILSENQQKQFEKYYNLLIEWNEKINLTAITEEKEVIYKHFLDSVYGAKYIPQNAKIVDIGVGAGFPSIPLKIIRPDLNFVLIDSLSKRINFLNEVINELKLTNVTAIHARCEDLAIKIEYRESFDVAVARAVAKMNTLAEYMLPFVKIGGYMIAYKGAGVQNEIDEGQKAIEILGGQVDDMFTYSLGEYASNHTILCIKKICATPKKYPRNGNKPKNSPIC